MSTPSSPQFSPRATTPAASPDRTFRPSSPSRFTPSTASAGPSIVLSDRTRTPSPSSTTTPSSPLLVRAGSPLASGASDGSVRQDAATSPTALPIRPSLPSGSSVLAGDHGSLGSNSAAVGQGSDGAFSGVTAAPTRMTAWSKRPQTLASDSTVSFTDFPAGSSNPLSRKLDKILNTKLDQDKDVLEALRALSTFYGDNSLRNRRNLRTDVEKRILGVSNEYLDSFKLVKERLDEVQAEVACMATCCEAMNDRLQAARAQTAGVIDRTSELQGRAQKLRACADVANAFVHKFQLTAEQTAALRGGVGSDSMDALSLSRAHSLPRQMSSTSMDEGQGQVQPLDNVFFEALQRAKEIHKDCNVLLRTNHQVIGLEIMDQMAVLQEAGYQRVYRWVHSECRGLSKGSYEASPTLRRALHVLRDRPALFKYCVDEIASTRKAAVSREFIDALAIGGPGGFPRPIEMHSHDPIRYVSDMLAWLHQSVAAEQELLTSLLTLPKDADTVKRYTTNPREPIAKRFSRTISTLNVAKQQELEAAEEAERQAVEQAKELLTSIMDGTCRPFKARLDQVLASEPGLVVCYKLANLLKFYHTTICQHVKSDSMLAATINEAWNTCIKVFMDGLNAHAKRLLASAHNPPPADLSPSQPHMQTLAMLKEIVASYSGALTSTDTHAAGQDKETGSIGSVLDAVLEPLLQAAQITCASLSAPNRAVYSMNCLTSIQSTLGLYEWAAHRFDSLERQLEEHLNDLAHAQTFYLLSRTGLADKLKNLNNWTVEKSTMPLSAVPGMSASEIRDSMLEFDNFLSMASHSLNLPQCDLLSSARLRKKVRERSIELVANAYATLYTAICDPKNLYPDSSATAPRTPEQVKTLLV